MKIAINRCFGGFDLSDAVYEVLISKGWQVTKYNEQGHYENDDAKIVDGGDRWNGLCSRYSLVGSDQDYRTNPDLIEVIEQLGEKANGRFGSIKIVEVPDDVEWEIDEYDGLETIHEQHRVWS